MTNSLTKDGDFTITKHNKFNIMTGSVTITASFKIQQDDLKDAVLCAETEWYLRRKVFGDKMPRMRATKLAAVIANSKDYKFNQVVSFQANMIAEAEDKRFKDQLELS